MRGMNQKVLGSFVVGIGLVAASYTYVNFGQSRSTYPLENQAAAPVRAAIPVTDEDNNGIEDWRDVFTVSEPVIIGEVSASYTPPTTVTGRLGISLFEEFVRAKNYGPFGQSQEELVANTVLELARETEQKLYGRSDITIMDTWTDADIKNYGNSMGASLLQNGDPKLENELVILSDIIENQNKDRIAELETIAGFYKTMRDQAIATPVPQKFVKEHLDLINVYEALYQDITAMQVSLDDAAVTLLRIRRYEDDVLGLQLALQNMYTALEPHASLFSAEDPAVIFGAFVTNSNP